MEGLTKYYLNFELEPQKILIIFEQTVHKNSLRKWKVNAVDQ